MSHHGTDPFDDPKRIEQIEKMKRDLLNTSTFRGALGDFPEGQLTKSDEGAVQFGVGMKDGKVVLDFGTPVAWVGMNPQQAAIRLSSFQASTFAEHHHAAYVAASTKLRAKIRNKSIQD